MKSEFKITDWELLSSFLGIMITRDAEKMKLSIGAKIDKLFCDHPKAKGMALSCARSMKQTPVAMKPAMPVGDPSELDLYFWEHYGSFVGSLIYMCITCRPDLSYGIGRLSRGMHKPSLQLVQMLQHALCYTY